MWTFFIKVFSKTTRFRIMKSLTILFFFNLCRCFVIGEDLHRVRYHRQIIFFDFFILVNSFFERRRCNECVLCERSYSYSNGLVVLKLCRCFALSSDRQHFSNTDLSDLSIMGTCNILVYQMRHKSHVICPIGWFNIVINLRHHLSLKPLL